MIILGIETSCDETAAALLERKNGCIQILSNVVASSAQLQAKYGGIIPEQAAREQIKSIIPVITEALEEAKVNLEQLGAIAVTYGPGLIGSLLVGVETAKTFATVWNKPLIPVNHLIGHFYANWITPATSLRDHEVAKQSQKQVAASVASLPPRNDGFEIPTFPCIGLLVSGGHTDLVLFTNHGKYEYLGGTRDDAAGECFDKCARLLGLPYPGGSELSKLAAKGKDIYKLPRPMIESDDFDFSFSGLKTAVANLVNTSEVKLKLSRKLNSSEVNNLAASIEAAIVEVLITKTVRAAQKYNIEQIMVAGGVAANQKLINDLRLRIKDLGMRVVLHVPPPALCTDNAAMIASAAFSQKPIKNPLALQAGPNLSLASP